MEPFSLIRLYVVVSAALSLFLLSMGAPASAAGWQPVEGKGFVGVGFVHDDEGAIFILCDPNTRLISILWNETRAKWTTGTPMKVTTRADAGDEYVAEGRVVGPSQLAIGQEATFSLHAMGKAVATFAVGNGVYARIFPAANFRKAVAPVLAACGDSW